MEQTLSGKQNAETSQTEDWGSRGLSTKEKELRLPQSLILAFRLADLSWQTGWYALMVAVHTI
jgi:hypothetical protein